jgi:outer membrane protein OmpA-like peptidoglycan-associated protein
MQKNPQSFVRPLLPAMVAPVRTVVAEALRSIREYLNLQQQQLTGLDEKSAALTQQLTELNHRLLPLEETLIRFSELEQRLNDTEHRTRDLADILPNAIRQVTQQTNMQLSTQQMKAEALADSLKIPVEQCLKQSVSEDAQTLADALFPVMGPAIRKSINESMKAMVEKINVAVEQSISPQAVVWRIESIRHGVPYSQIVMKNTLVYRVEQVFLIHRQTGLLVQHVSREESEVTDSDAVSAMLTAIQDFIRDSFSSNKNDELERAEVGEYTVWLERSPFAVLACVVRGIAPYEYKTTMRITLEAVHARYGFLLENFEGDSAPLEPCRSLLQQALQVEIKKKDKEHNNLSRYFSRTFIVVLVLLGCGLAAWNYWRWQQAQQFNSYLAMLHHSTGITILESKIEGDHIVLRGLRDPLAPDPVQLAQQYNLSAEQVSSQWAFYQDLSPEFVLKRLTAALNPPANVKFNLNNGILKATGHADRIWIDQLKRTVLLMAGLTKLDDSQLLDNNAYLEKTREQFEVFLLTLKATQGIVVVSSEVINGHREITGLRDPIAEDPAKWLPNFQLEDIAMNWTPYQDLTPSFVEKRARLRLAVPETVQLTVKEGRMTVQGFAPKAWIEHVQTAWQGIAGIEQADFSQLLERDTYLLAYAQRELSPPKSLKLEVKEGILNFDGWVEDAAFAKMQQAVKRLQGFESIKSQNLLSRDKFRQLTVQRLEKVMVYFNQDAGFNEHQENNLRGVLDLWQGLLTLTPTPPHLQLIGHTDGIGTQEQNRRLSIQRAEAVYRWLVNQGVAEVQLELAYPSNIPFGETTANFKERRVSFKVLF